VMIDEFGRQPIVYTLTVCRFIKEEFSATKGPDALKVPFGLFCGNIIRGGQILSASLGGPGF